MPPASCLRQSVPREFRQPTGRCPRNFRPAYQRWMSTWGRRSPPKEATMKTKSEFTKKSASASESTSKKSPPAVATASEAQRLAATILEVLGGVRSPPQAAQALAISLPRYYQLEARALE